jgi:hypothetical protein
MNLITRVLGTALGNVDKVPLKFNALIIEDCFTSKLDLQSKIQKHYLNQIALEVKKKN